MLGFIFLSKLALCWTVPIKQRGLIGWGQELAEGVVTNLGALCDITESRLKERRVTNKYFQKREENDEIGRAHV